VILYRCLLVLALALAACDRPAPGAFAEPLNGTWRTSADPTRGEFGALELELTFLPEPIPNGNLIVSGVGSMTPDPSDTTRVPIWVSSSYTEDRFALGLHSGDVDSPESLGILRVDLRSCLPSGVDCLALFYGDLGLNDSMTFSLQSE